MLGIRRVASERGSARLRTARQQVRFLPGALDSEFGAALRCRLPFVAVQPTYNHRGCTSASDDEYPPTQSHPGATSTRSQVGRSDRQPSLESYLARRANRHEAISALGSSDVEFYVQAGLSERDQVVVGFEEAEDMALVKPVEPLLGADDKVPGED